MNRAVTLFIFLVLQSFLKVLFSSPLYLSDKRSSRRSRYEDNLLCSPSHVVSTANTTNITLSCTITTCITDNVFTEWKIIEIRNAEGKISARHDSTTQDGSSKNVTTTAVINFHRKSSLLKSKVGVDVSIHVNGDNKNYKYDFIISDGSDTFLILICVFSILTGVLLILLVISVLKIRKRRQDQQQSSNFPQTTSPLTIPRSELINNAEDLEDDWSSVDLNSPSLENSNRGFMDDLTVLENENYHSRYISQVSATRSHGAEAVIPSLGRAEVVVGGGADLGAGQIRVRDHEEVEVVQLDHGTGYTAVRRRDTGEYGFVPTSSLHFH